MEKHPDIFDDQAAAQYLSLPGPRSMDRLSRKYGVSALDLPGPRKWHRADLDALLEEARGLPERTSSRNGGAGKKRDGLRLRETSEAR